MARILVIDDDAAIRSLLRAALEQGGFEVVEASDGDAGVKLYRQDPADLVITDIIMPKKSGADVIRELRNDYPGVRVIAITGGVHDFPAIARIYGADRTIRKPFRPNDILVAVNELLEKEQSS